MAFCLLFSLIYGSGAIFILTWNASVLGTAIGNYIKSKDPDVRIVYASSEKFTNELLDYLRLGEMEKFRIKY